jgi:2-polyprenyl-3-methyl-5-hydroxy-6-metoxy-1,4-benzoquinol methylase
VSESSSYVEFEWHDSDSGNGQVTNELAEVFVRKVSELEGIKRICDLGSGNGYISGRLASLGYDVVGIDGSPSGIQLSKESYPTAEFICAQIGETLVDRLGIEPVDLVISSDVIEHLYRPADLLIAAAGLLKPHGHLLLGTPYHGYLKNVALSVTGKMDNHFTVLWEGGHIKFFSVRTLSMLVSQYGFKPLDFTYYGRAPWLWKNMICHARSI